MRNSKLSSRPQAQSYNMAKNCQPLSSWGEFSSRVDQHSVSVHYVIRAGRRMSQTHLSESHLCPDHFSLVSSTLNPSPMHSFGRHWIVPVREDWKCSQVQLAYFPPSQWAWTNGSVQSGSEEINTFPLVPELHNEPDSIASSSLTLPCNLGKKAHMMTH